MISAQTEADVIDAVRTARAMDRTLEIVGAGTKRSYGRPITCDDVLDVSALRGIVKYEPAELILTALPEHRLRRSRNCWIPKANASVSNLQIGGRCLARPQATRPSAASSLRM